MARSDFQPESITLPELPSGWYLSACTVTNSGSLAILAKDIDLSAGQFDWTNPGAIQARYNASAQANICLWEFDGKELDSGIQVSVKARFAKVDRFSDGQWLVVDSRTSGVPNGFILSSSGDLCRKVLLGDGIEQIAIAPDETIWVGWFDEGVGGNTDWKMAGQDWPPSSEGVGHFDRSGRFLPQRVYPENGDFISDCYALRVGPDAVWHCCYADFPIVGLYPSGDLRWWCNSICGATALAVDGAFALLAGGYGNDSSRLVLVSLEGSGTGEMARPIAEWQLPLTASKRSEFVTQEMVANHLFEAPTLLTGRGDTVHLIVGSNWFRYRVKDAVELAAKRPS